MEGKRKKWSSILVFIDLSCLAYGVCIRAIAPGKIQLHRFISQFVFSFYFVSHECIFILLFIIYSSLFATHYKCSVTFNVHKRSLYSVVWELISF